MSYRKKLNNVFTPRNDEVNDEMYIRRPELEKKLIRKLEGSKHIIIYGESGCGKSWLYKKILSDENISYGSINLAKTKRMGSITNIFKDELAKIEPYKKTKYTNIKNAGASTVFFSGELENQNRFEKIDGDPIREYINSFNKKKPIIVLDNLESIFNNSKFMDELGDILTLLDDPDYKAKFLIVGVPSEVIQYYSNKDLLKTVANRLTELPQVTGLNREQVEEFVKKGFVKELKVNLNEKKLKKISEHVLWVTNGIPQKLQEYCKILGYQIEDNNWTFNNDMLQKADKEWVLDSLHKNYTMITGMMNSNKTELGRRNQVLYCLGKIDKTFFKSHEIEQLVRKEFKTSTKGKGLNISLILNDLAAWKNSFIKKSNNEYIITDKEYIMCIRIMLHKTKTGKVEKLDIENMQ